MFGDMSHVGVVMQAPVVDNLYHSKDWHCKLFVENEFQTNVPSLWNLSKESCARMMSMYLSSFTSLVPKGAKSLSFVESLVMERSCTGILVFLRPFSVVGECHIWVQCLSRQKETRVARSSSIYIQTLSTMIHEWVLKWRVARVCVNRHAWGNILL